MPPASNMRKSSMQTVGLGDSHRGNAFNSTTSNGVPPRRTTASGRTIRQNTTRPANYYARPFGSISTAAGHDNDADDSGNAQPPGFYPAIQYFTDAIAALPKEVMKQFTLVKEVEAKVYSGNEKLGELIDGLMDQPVPRRKQGTSSAAATTAAQGLMSMTANNSTSGSTNASMVNGAPGRHNSAQPSMAGSGNGEEVADTEEEGARRSTYYQLRLLTHSLLANLDEKNVVLAEANRVLAQQESRLDSVWPHVEGELHEESRMGSMTHWAYSDNRQKTKAGAPGAANRRDVAATNNLAAAASLFHENDIANMREKANREVAREKTKGKRTEPTQDSDFDDKPKKGPKGGKGKAAANAAVAATGLGISTNGEPATKRKKTEKGMTVPSMERQPSTQGKGKAAREAPRSTPTTEPAGGKKPKSKPGPPPGRKKPPVSAHNSPMLASSPLASNFAQISVESGAAARPQSARLRQNSTATNLRHERVQEEDSSSRPASAAGKPNGNAEKTNGRRKVQETTEEHDEPSADDRTAKQLQGASEKLKREDTEIPDAGGERQMPNSRSGSNSRKGSGRQSNVGTPRTDTFSGEPAAMLRSRSTRSRPGAREDSSSVEPPVQGAGNGRHKRNMSNSHLVKQLAPFNKSPDLDRHRNRDDIDDEPDSDDRELNNEGPERGDEPPPQEQDEAQQAVDREPRRSSTRRPISRRNTVNTVRSSPAPNSRESSSPVSPPSTSTHGRTTTHTSQPPPPPPPPPPAAEPEPEPAEEEDDESEHDPDDPDEPKYCYCNRGSYGEMVACDNESCPREWFHLGCTELREAPSEEDKWYCRECRPAFTGRGRGVRGGRGRGRGP
ncbi:Chromatin modification-related png1 [Lecanosticta acicola]|uniref:Chromatin modification-related png1 n=1 Tax=Lecanosticta acicola TaxID=111012 RepID=A0AAI8YZ86_9PEZI|nr:Chromatin modification-related png1 [Lecanosticta acicola]